MGRSEGALWAIVAAAAVAWGLWAGGGGRASAAGPVEPAWGRQPCAECGMLLDDPFYACEIRGGGGRNLYFDDPGCLLSYLRTHPLVGQAYVHDLKGRGWIALGRAGFVVAPGSPMGYGLGCVGAGFPGARGIAWARLQVAAFHRRRGHGADPWVRP